MLSSPFKYVCLMKILVFTTDMLPLAEFPTSGTALRTFGLAQGLRAHGQEVITSVPKSALTRFLKHNQKHPSLSKEKLQELTEFAFDGYNQSDVVARVNPDVILCGHWPALSLRVKPSQIVVVDLAGPHLLERHYQGDSDPRTAVLTKLGVVASADYFITSGPSQRLYFLSFLLRAGIEDAEQKIVQIPMPLDPKLPERTFKNLADNSYPRFIFGGVFLPWQDPSWGLKQLIRELDVRQTGSLSLIGGKHPHYNIDTRTYDELFSELSQHPRVKAQPMLPYGSFVSQLQAADVALDLMGWNLERELAIPIRSSTYLWAGLPLIFNDYSDISQLLREYDAGWCISPGDESAFKEVIEEIYSNPELVKQKSQNAQALARAEFSWDKAAKPLLEILKSPRSEPLSETDIIVDGPENADLNVYGSNVVRQYFGSRIDGLAQVQCRIATHARSNIKDTTFRLYRLGKQAAELEPANFSVIEKKLLEEQHLAAEEISNNDWHTIEIKPIADSAGSVFLLEIEAQESEESESISPWAVKSSPYPLLGLSYGERFYRHMGLCFKTTSSRCYLSSQE